MAKVMIVDDDRTTVQLLCTLLELDGFEVSVSPTGAQVVPLAEQHPPDLFLLDYHLSDMHGVDVVVSLRAHDQFRQTPIVITSGLNVEKEVLAAGASRFIMKPFDPDKLQPLFQSLIGGS